MGILFNIAVSCKILRNDCHAIWKRHMAWLMSACTLIYMASGAYCLMKGNLYMFSYAYYLSWLMVMAYVDYETGYVYGCMEYAVILPIALGMAGTRQTYAMPDGAASLIASVLITYAVLKIMERAGCMGGGDCDALFFHAVITDFGIIRDIYGTGGADYIVMKCVFANMAFMMLASMLFIIRNIRNISFKKMALKERRPFLPSIYMAAVLSLLAKMLFF